MKAITQKEIAKKANVSVMTVSRVINNERYVDEEVRKRIWQIVKKNNYSMNVMARGLRTNKVNALGIIMRPGTNAFAVPYFSELLRGVEQVCIEKRYDILLGTSEYRNFEYQKLISQKKAAGYIIVAPSVSDLEDFAKIDATHCPFIIVNSRGDFNYIDADNSESTYSLVRSMIAEGRKRLSIVLGPLSAHNAAERFEAFRKAVKDAGLQLHEEYVFEGRFDRISGEEAGARIASMKNRPDAVFASNDLMAIGLISELTKRGIRVPEEIAVAGYDNIGSGEHLSPALTTINPHAFKLGEQAAEALFELIVDNAKEIRKIIPAEVVMRESFKLKNNM